MSDGARADPNPRWREHLSGKSIFHRYVAPKPDGEANNPAMIAFTEAQRSGPTDVILVSLGFGEAIEEPNWDRVDDWGLAEWARSILNVVFDGASEAADYELRHLLGPERYHRFQVPLTTANHRMDDASPENIDKLQVDAARMIAQRAAEIDEVTEKLAR